MKKWIVISAAAVSMFLAVWAVLVWWTARDHFPHEKLNQLAVSMSTNEVQKILGSPPHEFTRTNEQGQTRLVWSYPAGVLASVYIYFTPDGHFEKHDQGD